MLSKRFVKSYPVLVEGFEIETDMTLHALDKRFVVVEVDIEYKDRPAGSVSKLNTIADGIKVVRTIFNIARYYKPLYFFGVLSSVFMLGALFAGCIVLSDWFTYKYIYHLPMAVLATGLVLTSILFMSIGLILDSIAHQNKYKYELVQLDIKD